MPADAGFDLAIGNEYYAGGWVWCSDSFRAQSESKMRTMPIEEGQLSQVIAVRRCVQVQ